MENKLKQIIPLQAFRPRDIVLINEPSCRHLLSMGHLTCTWTWCHAISDFNRTYHHEEYLLNKFKELTNGL